MNIPTHYYVKEQRMVIFLPIFLPANVNPRKQESPRRQENPNANQESPEEPEESVKYFSQKYHSPI